MVGRTRLQKVAYLLEVAGLGEGFAFEYRHYGPYSAELAVAARRAGLLGLIEEKEKVANWGGLYSIYSVTTAATNRKTARTELAKAAAAADPIELELAATAAFLSYQTTDPWGETARRKADKAAGGRIEKAKALYERLAGVKTPKRLPSIV